MSRHAPLGRHAPLVRLVCRASKLGLVQLLMMFSEFSYADSLNQVRERLIYRSGVEWSDALLVLFSSDFKKSERFRKVPHKEDDIVPKRCAISPKSHTLENEGGLWLHWLHNVICHVVRLVTPGGVTPGGATVTVTRRGGHVTHLWSRCLHALFLHSIPSKHGTLTQCWYDVGPAS